MLGAPHLRVRPDGSLIIVLGSRIYHQLIDVAREDHVPMVKMHIAMILGHLAVYEDHIGEIVSSLLGLLDDDSVFAKSWAIVSLCIIGRKYPTERSRIVDRIAQLQGDSSVAIRSKVKNAVDLLTNEGASFPKGWIKSKHLRSIEGHR